jgi:hypothetical protein
MKHGLAWLGAFEVNAPNTACARRLDPSLRWNFCFGTVLARIPQKTVGGGEQVQYNIDAAQVIRSGAKDNG